MEKEKGYIITLISFFVMIIMLAIAVSVGFLNAMSQKKITTAVKSTQSYYASEAGIEDALLRLKRTPTMSATSYNFFVSSAAVSVNIPVSTGVTRSVNSQAVNASATKTIQATCTLANTDNANFYYGVQTGAGGLVNNGTIKGNVFSDGPISGSGTIDNNVVISGNAVPGNSKSISGVTVGGNVLAYSCLAGTTVAGSVTCVTGGTCNCKTPHGTQDEEISQQPMPIPQTQIDDWITEASLNNCNSSLVSRLSQNNKSVSLGPCKITGNISFGNGVTLTLTGVLYVTGNISFGNNDIVKLSSSYGTLGGAFIIDGTIDVKNNANFLGSGQAGSYLLMISNNASDSAISIRNNTQGAVFYTTQGAISIYNGVSLVEATGYKIIMNNGSEIQYSSGIVNIYFSSGPAAGWKVTSWSEQ